MTTRLPERHESLWWIAAPAVIWAVRFLAAYAIGAIACAKQGELGAARVAMVALSGVSLALLGLIAWRAARGLRLDDATSPHDFDTREDRHRFLAFATLTISGLTAVSIVYETLPAVLIRSCV